MSATTHDILLTTDELVADLEGQEIYAITIHERTLNGIYAHVTVQLGKTLHLAPLGALIDLAARINLEQIEIMRPGARRVRGVRDGITVELFA
jgi:hypothetical protein